MKRVVVLSTLAVVAGCLVKQGPLSGETGEAEDSGKSGEVSYYGTPPESPISAPEFVATNRDGTARGQSDLIGKPTAMWFYPAAGTFG